MRILACAVVFILIFAVSGISYAVDSSDDDDAAKSSSNSGMNILGTAILGGLLGGGVGAAIGSASGHAGTGALIGAGVGAVGGGVVGAANEESKKSNDAPAPAKQATEPKNEKIKNNI